ncbi:MAG: hypothetical protein JO122_05140, partial [Acetobacteraceae bacterium]|nr:hypothetical protein [Acetobacteraceae bacterium]
MSDMEDLLEPTSDPAWLITKEGFDPLREAIYEARFAISNGFAGVRGGRAISRGSRWIEPNRTYIAGLFDIPGPEHPIPELIAAPGWLQFRIIAGGEPLARHPAEVGSHRATLDMRRGVLISGARLIDQQSATVRARALRLVSLAERAIGVHVVEVEIEQGEIELTLESSFEGLGLGLISERLEQDFAVWRTRYSGKRLAMAAASWLHIDGVEHSPTRPGSFAWSWHWKTRPGQVVCLSRVVAAARGDTPDADPGRVVREKFSAAQQLGWHKVVQQHEAAWAERW